jgi:hypothetical protein
VAFLEFVRVKTILLGVAATVRELATANVRLTAAALLVVWAGDSAADMRLNVTAAMTEVTCLKVLKVNAP